MIKHYKIQYGPQTITLDIDSSRVSFILQPGEMPIVETRQELYRALAVPIGAKPLRDIVKTGDRVVIMGDDATRLTPTKEIIPIILDELNAGGVPDKDLELIIATGTHRAMTEEELEDKYGSGVTNRIKVTNHDCLNTDNLVPCGTTSRGTDIWINKTVMEADVAIGVGNILPHHPTGWSGGAKILLPGVAGEHSVGQMHLLGATEQQLGKIDTPCREEMEDFAHETGLDFIVNTVLDREGNVVRIVAGHFIEAHREGIQWGQKVFGVPFKEKTDITLSSSFPCDHDLFQATKGLFSTVHCTKQGGEVILISPCTEGVSPTHPETVELAKLSDHELLALAADPESGHDVLSITAALYLNSSKRAVNVTLVTEGIPKETVEKLGFRHLRPSDLAEYLTFRLAEDPNATLGIVHNSAEVVPLQE
ncbi:MAG: nickel-dependent lactate racemase [Verrucomicrobia bacterium]|nr:nickel-dependent lactate racemase [Verrucomicrobiota bacterium]